MLNEVKLIGNLGKDPEVRALENGSKVANFSLATSESYNNRQGERVTMTEWHSVVVWGNLAEVVEKYLQKGSKIYVSGKLKTRNYDDKQGQKRYVTEVVLEAYGSKLIMLDGKQESEPEKEVNISDHQEPETDLPF